MFVNEAYHPPPVLCLTLNVGRDPAQTVIGLRLAQKNERESLGDCNDSVEVEELID